MLKSAKPWESMSLIQWKGTCTLTASRSRKQSHIKRLKDTLFVLIKGKNEYIRRAIDAEKSSEVGGHPHWKLPVLPMKTAISSDGRLSSSSLIIPSGRIMQRIPWGNWVFQRIRCKTWGMKLRIWSRSLEMRRILVPRHWMLWRLRRKEEIKRETS